jgi:hypothetical protein
LTELGFIRHLANSPHTPRSTGVVLGSVDQRQMPGGGTPETSRRRPHGRQPQDSTPAGSPSGARGRGAVGSIPANADPAAPPPPDSVPLTQEGVQTLYVVELSAKPSPAWCAAFFRPPARLTTARMTPELGRLELTGHRVTFRTIPARLHAWLRRIDRWIAYANSVVAE